jgi:putative ABC transport system substrate-binding protein
MERAIGAVCGVALSPCMAPPAWAADARNVVVVLPDIGEPFRSVFAKIVEGIEARVHAHVSTLAVGAQSEADIAEELRKREARVVVALGRQGLKSVAALEGSAGLAIVAGCVVSVPEAELRGYPVYTLAPDPSLLFAQLHRLLPGVRRVHVVHDPRQTGWLIRRAREAVKPLSLELSAYESADLAAAVRHYQQLLATADAAHDAVWLPQDSTTVDEATVLPLVLKEAWNRSVTAFSSNVAHVKRGALFALYPDNEELGHTLGDAASRLLAGNKPAEGGALPLRDVRSAINTRTATHLGIASGTRLAGFDLVFPEP